MNGSKEETKSVNFTALTRRDSWPSVTIQNSNQTPGFLRSSISPQKYSQATLKEVKCQDSPPSISPQPTLHVQPSWSYCVPNTKGTFIYSWMGVNVDPAFKARWSVTSSLYLCLSSPSKVTCSLRCICRLYANLYNRTWHRTAQQIAYVTISSGRLKLLKGRNSIIVCPSYS